MYKVNKAQFLLCAAWKSQWPDHQLPEVCLAGRNINDEICLVDVPGYGYAKVSDAIKESFADMIDTYLRERDLLKGLILIVDYRHKPTHDDVQMYQYAKYYQIPVIVVATKEDKLKRNDLKKNEKRIKETLDFQEGDLFVRFSSLNKVGIDELWQAIFQLCEL